MNVALRPASRCLVSVFLGSAFLGWAFLGSAFLGSAFLGSMLVISFGLRTPIAAEEPRAQNDATQNDATQNDATQKDATQNDVNQSDKREDSTPPELTFLTAGQVLQRACSECHKEGTAEGGLSLALLASESSLRNDFRRWQLIRQRILDRSMPPADSPPLADVERDSLESWIQKASIAAISQAGPKAGPPILRRLARYEYSNSIRDLLDIHFDAGQGLPEDTAGGEGFDNASETLTVSPIHAEKYLQAAVDALDYAARDDGARKRLLASQPTDEQPEVVAARINLLALASRAFRRPVFDEDVERFVAVFQQARSDQLSFDEAVLFAMRGILISPNFLFISEASPAAVDIAEPLTDHELAVRLSYFLWASTPDAELRSAADEGKLNNDEELKRQCIRLIGARGTRFQDSMYQFVGSWLGTADLGRAKQIDRGRHQFIKDPHVSALVNQPVYAVESIIKENESVLSLIDAPWTFLNNELVRVYRIKREDIKEQFVQRLVKVNLPDHYRYRGGLVGMGGVLAVSSPPSRSSPVLRGAWVLEKMLGVELPPPPPGVPPLDESRDAVVAKTLRGRLEQHRQDPACASCHNRIDPIGFSLENFDEIGRWRDKDDGGPIDAKASLPGNVELEGVAGLKKHLMSHKDTFARVFTRKMLGYALGRSLQPTDLGTVESIVQTLKTSEYRGQDLVVSIVMSDPFRKKILLKGDTK